MPYPTHLAATLSGASLRQLQYWRQTRLLVPELQRDGGRLRYSFRDLVALRTFVFLREGWSLPAIRTAVANLRLLGEKGHLAGYRLVSVGDDIVLVPESTPDVTSLYAQPGHGRMAIVLGDVMRPFVNMQGAKVVDLERPRNRLSVNPETQGGYPVIAGTRIEYDLIAGLVSDGVPASEIRDFYPSVDEESAEDAAAFDALVRQYQVGMVPSAV